jgi:hypothetical protein
MSEEYKVKGSTLLSKIQFVRERSGPEAEQRLRDELSRRGFPPMFETGWVAFERYVELLEIITKLFFGGDSKRLEEVGEYSARHALGTTYEVFVRGKDFVDFLKHISQLHKMFYSHGRIEVVLDKSGRSCKILHRDKPKYAMPDIHVAVGFYRGAGQLLGLKYVSVRFERDPQGVTFTLTW